MKYIKKISSVLLIGLISACSSSPNDAEENLQANKITANQASITRIEQDLALFQQMKPSLERLVLIETELKSLIKELSRMTAKQNKQADIKPKNTTVITPVPKEPLISSSKETTKASYSDHALQVYTIDNKASLERTWSQWSQKHTTALLNLSKIYQTYEDNGINYYRIKIVNFNTKQDALNTCVTIKQQGGDCFLTNNIGQVF